MINQNQVYINGQFVDAITAEQIDVIDPATSDVIARVPNAGRADVQKAVAAARAAFDNGPWSDSGLDGPTALQRLSRDDAPQYLLHDRDSVFAHVPTTLERMNLQELRTAPRSPWTRALFDLQLVPDSRTA